MKNKNLRIIFSLPCIILSLGFIIESSFPMPEFMDLGFNFQDKIYHLSAFIIYGIFVALFLLVNYKNLTNRNFYIISFLIGSLFGASDELHQYFVPGRSCDVFDWIFDTCGVLIGLYIYHKFLINLIKNKFLKTSNNFN